MERLRKEHIEALRDIKRLQEQLMESQRVHHQKEEELSKVKQEVQLGAEDSRALRTRIHLVEAAQKQARGMEMDYEEVIHLLEAEIAELKTQRVEQPPSTNQEETDEMKKKVSVLECQLRKSEASKKSFELSTGRLLRFVENVQDFLLESPGPAKSYSSGDVKVGASPQGPPPRYRKSPWTAAALAQEAAELTRTVRAILEVDLLTFFTSRLSEEEVGGALSRQQEVINQLLPVNSSSPQFLHMTQTTSWSRPAASGSVGPPTPPPASEREAEPAGETTEQRPSPSIETEM
ncbi:syntaxin-binding protein 4 [Pleuronectes platessa]|uniref:syntaxin-binding protein 4 n=1 Tax=Pleuronectes platessa TaxID=8262 RepID=UPI00232A27F2|nr:syntaxin-binding protein 4 [Pleuronectes platessa]